MDATNVDYAAAQRLAEKRANQVAAQEAARPIAERIDAHGQVRVWDPEAEKYLKLWPIDARTQIDLGLVLLDKPEEPEVAAESDGDDSGQVPVTLSPEMTVAQLRQLAADNDIDLSGLTKKDDIYAALELALSQNPPDQE